MELTYILFIGMFLEICFDWPKFLYNKIKHPMVWIGNFITLIDKNLNKDNQKHNYRLASGFIAVAICITVNLSCFFLV